MVFLNINICRNNMEDVRQLTEYAHAHHIATDYHINETPMLEQDDHFKHLSDNPTYIRPTDWRRTDELIDWLIEKNKAGYQMVNSVQRLEEIKAFMRMGGNASELKTFGWNGDGTRRMELRNKLHTCRVSCRMPRGICTFAEWSCRAGQNNVIIRTDGTVAPMFPDVCFAL